MTTSRSENKFSFLKKIHDGFQSLAGEFKFDQEHSLHRYIVKLYGSIFELTSSSILIFDSGLVTGIPIVQRAMLEAHVDLLNLIKDPLYGYHLKLSYCKEWLKILKAAQVGNNRYLKEMSNWQDLGVFIDELQREEKYLETQGYRELRKIEKFQKVDMEEEYRSIYNRYCSASHNDLRALIERHTVPAGNSDGIVFFKSYTVDECEMYISLNITIFMEATRLVHQFFDSLAQPKIKIYEEEYEKICKLV